MFTVKRLGEIIKQLSSLRYPESVSISGWKMQVRSGETRPDPTVFNGDWTDIPETSFWGGDQEYRVFAGKATIPDNFRGKIVEFQLLTGREGQWDATNPQFSVYVNGKLRQGFDTNHTSVVLMPSPAKPSICSFPHSQEPRISIFVLTRRCGRWMQQRKNSTTTFCCPGRP